MWTKLYYIYFLICFVNLYSCKSGRLTSDKKVSYEIIYQDYYKGANVKSYRLVKEFEDYKGVFISLKVAKIPQVDFKTSNVLVLNLGKRKSSGYAVYPEKIIEYSGKLVVVLKEVTPKSHEVIVNNYSNPITVVKINSKKDIILR